MPYKDKQKQREYRKEYHKKYYKENKERLLKQNKEYKIKNKVKVRGWRKKWKKNNPEKLKEGRKRYIEGYKKRYPEKIKAENEANRKIKIPRGKLCEDCNKNLAVEKHHEDYNKPLEVNFLCWECHNRRTNGTNEKPLFHINPFHPTGLNNPLVYI